MTESKKKTTKKKASRRAKPKLSVKVLDEKCRPTWEDGVLRLKSLQNTTLKTYSAPIPTGIQVVVPKGYVLHFRPIERLMKAGMKVRPEFYGSKIHEGGDEQLLVYAEAGHQARNLLKGQVFAEAYLVKLEEVDVSFDDEDSLPE